jgi:mannose-6-phosphate isomerase
MLSSPAPTLSDWVPFRIAPRFDSRPWGSTDLRPWYDKVAQGEPLGEAWLTGDDSLIATGPHAGTALGALFAKAPEPLLGAAAAHGAASPLLIKVIFAKQKLSVQVHPDDAMAQKYGQPRGKTECWYVLAADPGAQVACGLKPGVTLEQVKNGISDGTLEQSLNLLDVKAGEMIFVDAGTVHAIWPGTVLLETQQNCDLTYRMYDYGRPRQLHVEKSLEATRLSTRAGKIAPRLLVDRSILIDGNYFRVERIPVNRTLSAASLRAPDESQPGLAYLFAAAGAARILSPSAAFAPLDLPPRGIVAVPAAAPNFVLEDAGGLDLIRMTPHWPSGL